MMLKQLKKLSKLRKALTFKRYHIDSSHQRQQFLFHISFHIIKVSMRSDNCFKHNEQYQLIGSDSECELNCRICLNCLRSLDNGHKKGVSNHQTLSMEQIAVHFKKLEEYNHHSISECNDALNRYFLSFEALLREEITKEKNRISKIYRKILLSGITPDDRKLDSILALYNQDFNSLKCSQVAEVKDDLFNFVPKDNLVGFKKFIEYINTKQIDLSNDMKEIVQSKTWERISLKNCEKDVIVARPPPTEREQSPKTGMEVSRVKTEEDSPKKTLRRSVIKDKKVQKKPDLKDFTVQLKKPLELNGCKVIENRDEAVFMARLFDHRHVAHSYLLYRASQHNFSIKEFHRLCDNETNTLIIVKTQFNKVIGGFTPLPWKSTANTLHSDIRGESFLFSLSLKQKMGLVDDKSAIFNSSNFGPTFGAGADLAICHNGNTQKTSYSQFPYSYANSRYKQNHQHSTALFTGQKVGNHFLLKEWEVWKLTFAE